LVQKEVLIFKKKIKNKLLFEKAASANPKRYPQFVPILFYTIFAALIHKI
jgi:hypothetical protein